MKSFIIRPCSSVSGEVKLPGDKSIAHRALIVSALAQGSTVIRNIPANDDCYATIEALRCFGVKLSSRQEKCPCGTSLCVTVRGAGLHGLRAPANELFVGESGTTLRLLAGLAAAQPFRTEFDAGSSLSRRPMARITQPLRLMGARITGCRPAHGTADEEYPPLVIQGGKLRGISYTLPVASAQVKSALLLAGLYASGRTIVTEPVKTRDHTERMLKAFGCRLSVQGNTITMRGPDELKSPRRLLTPGDISSAAFFLVLASLLPKSRLALRGVSLNPARAGIVRALKAMGAEIKVVPDRRQACEPCGDIVVRSAPLKALRVRKEEVPGLIDELPVLMVAACYARGTSVFEGVGELRVKETDRIHSMTENLRRMGGKVAVISRDREDVVEITGVTQLTGAAVHSYGDHRTAMSMVVAGLAARGQTSLDDSSCIAKSFPGFLGCVKKISKAS